MKKVFLAFGLVGMSFLANATDNAPQSAKLIVYRKGCIYGSMARYKVIEDGNELTTLKNKSSYATDLTAGTHTIAPKNSKKGVTINAQDGQTYVVKYKTRFGLFGARPKLEVMTLEQAKQDSKFSEIQSNMVM